jgi:Fic family protein
VITYNPNYLDNTDIFTQSEIKLLEELNKKVSLEKFLNNKSYIDKFGLDFIHTSALIEGNTYDKLDTQALIEYGRTAGGKKYSDAKMILNLRDACDVFITQDLKPSKQTLKDLHYILSFLDIDSIISFFSSVFPFTENVTRYVIIIFDI